MGYYMSNLSTANLSIQRIIIKFLKLYHSLSSISIDRYKELTSNNFFVRISIWRRIMNFKDKIKPNYIIKELTEKEFKKNPHFYQKSLNEITISQKLCSSNDHNDFLGPENWDKFFKNHPINTLVYIMEKGKIVSFLYATPHRDYECYADTDLEHWGVNYIQTHKEFEGKGYGTILTLVGLENMKGKGAKRVDFLANRDSLPILLKVVSDNKIGELVNNFSTGKETLSFSEEYINRDLTIQLEKDR